MLIEFDNDVIEFPDDLSDDEIGNILNPTKEEPVSKPALKSENKLEPGVYQDEEGSLYKVTEDGEIVEHA